MYLQLQHAQNMLVVTIAWSTNNEPLPCGSFVSCGGIRCPTFNTPNSTPYGPLLSYSSFAYGMRSSHSLSFPFNAKHEHTHIRLTRNNGWHNSLFALRWQLLDTTLSKACQAIAKHVPGNPCRSRITNLGTALGNTHG